MSTLTTFRAQVIVNSHVESKRGATVHVERLELSSAGTALLTANSTSIDRGHRPADSELKTVDSAAIKRR